MLELLGMGLGATFDLPVSFSEAQKRGSQSLTQVSVIIHGKPQVQADMHVIVS